MVAMIVDMQIRRRIFARQRDRCYSCNAIVDLFIFHVTRLFIITLVFVNKSIPCKINRSVPSNFNTTPSKFFSNIFTTPLNTNWIRQMDESIRINDRLRVVFSDESIIRLFRGKYSVLRNRTRYKAHQAPVRCLLCHHISETCYYISS